MKDSASEVGVPFLRGEGEASSSHIDEKGGGGRSEEDVAEPAVTTR